MKLLTVKKHGYTLWATINRPEVRNAVNMGLMEQFEQLVERLETEESIRCFVLSGAGPTFIAGGDLKEFHGMKTTKEVRPMAQKMIHILERIEQLPCWTIAAINGPAYGGGCEIMLAFDFRIASESAVFGFSQGRFYLPPGWGGLTRLVEQVGRSTALQWLAGCAEIDTTEALEYRLINRVARPEQLRSETLQWAKKLSRNDRAYIEVLKTGAVRAANVRREAIRKELEPFCKFWETELHFKRVEEFLNR